MFLSKLLILVTGSAIPVFIAVEAW